MDIGALPVDTLSKIFSFVSFPDQRNVRPVCKNWRGRTHIDYLRRMFQESVRESVAYYKDNINSDFRRYLTSAVFSISTDYQDDQSDFVPIIWFGVLATFADGESRRMKKVHNFSGDLDGGVAFFRNFAAVGIQQLSFLAETHCRDEDNENREEYNSDYTVQYMHTTGVGHRKCCSRDFRLCRAPGMYERAWPEDFLLGDGQS